MIQNMLKTRHVPVWMTIDARGTTVGGPSGVGNTGVAFESLLEVDVGAINHLPELGNFADFFEGKNLASLISIDTKTGGIIAAILQAG
jgi:hypothetical protein